jgi:hypothetical protein
MKTFKIVHEQHSLMPSHNFFDVADADWTLEMTGPICAKKIKRQKTTLRVRLMRMIE